MESNWLEIKRFLNDNKKTILIGSTVLALFFASAMYLVAALKEESVEETKQDFEVPAEEIFNDAQPAYFQIFIEYEDGTAFGNPSIINQYFNLNSVKEDVKKNTGIDIKAVEEEVSLSDLSDEIEVVNVVRNDSSYLLTAVFNLGDEQDNLAVAEYYYKLLYSDEFSILADKKSYVFSEPTLTMRSSLAQAIDNREIQERNSTNHLIMNVINVMKNMIIGFIFGVGIMVGIELLKAIYGKTLNYSFAYEVEEENNFILYDEKLENEDIVSQFVSVPYDSRKILVTEKRIDSKNEELLFGDQPVGLNTSTNKKERFMEINSLTEIDSSINMAEIIIVIYPNITTRKWYRVQKKLAAINNFPTKIVQINR